MVGNKKGKGMDYSRISGRLREEGEGGNMKALRIKLTFLLFQAYIFQGLETFPSLWFAILDFTEPLKRAIIRRLDLGG